MSRRSSVWLRVAWWLSLGIGAFGGMLLAAKGFRSQWPWSYPAWTFWSVFRDLASMPVTGYGGVGMVFAIPLLGAASAGLHVSRKGSPTVAAVAGPLIALATGYFWMWLGDLVASLGV